MEPEFHRPVLVERIGPSGFSDRIEASEPERAALARRLGVPALAALACSFRLTRAFDGVVAAEGRLEARVTRVCVVSLDEFETDVSADFRVRFVPANLESAEFDLEVDDEIPYDGGGIDLGEAAAQELALALDPYPRKPDAELPVDPTEVLASPFAALQSRRRIN